MKPPSVILRILVVVLALSAIQARASVVVLEANLSYPMIGGPGVLEDGIAFFRVEGDRIEYQVFFGQNAVSVSSGTLTSNDGFTRDLLLGDANVITLGGCDLIPSNPYIAGGSVPPFDPGGQTCHALKTWDGFEEEVTDPELAQRIVAGFSFDFIVETDSPTAAGPFHGRLSVVPEASTFMMLAVGVGAFLGNRRRQNKSREGKRDDG